MDEIDYTRMDSAQLLNALGDDASKWAKALAQHMRRPSPGFDLSEDVLHGWFANAIEHAKVLQHARARMTPAEALYGIMAWLTTREVPVTFGRNHHAGVAVELIKRFLEANGVDDDVRPSWPNNLVHPKD